MSVKCVQHLSENLMVCIYTKNSLCYCCAFIDLPLGMPLFFTNILTLSALRERGGHNVLYLTAVF